MSQSFDMMNTPEAARLMENPAALKALLSSPETKRLMAALSKQNGTRLNAAAMQAKKGDTAALAAMVNDFAASREGGALLRQLEQGMGR